MGKANILVCITSCNRLNVIRRILPPYIAFTCIDCRFDVLLALDGADESYCEFCNAYNIPLLWSDQREGVGLSKNRVITQFPNYDYYFFIDDDVELINSDIFDAMIGVSQKCNYHHMSITPLKKVIKEEVVGGITIQKGFYGGGYFNFYTREGLDKVGGWHTSFAALKRFGHTEHSFRFMHSGLSDFPFIVPSSLMSSLLLHDPPHVTKEALPSNANELVAEEQAMIDQKQSYFPLTTLSAFHYNQIPFGYNAVVADLLANSNSRYPLLKGKEKFKALSDFYFFKHSINKGFFKKIAYFGLSFFLNPLSPRIKHRMKQLLGLVK